MKKASEPYYRRTLRMKSVLERDTGILRNAGSVFRNVYLKERLQEGVVEIGRGSNNIFFGIGKTYDPENPARDIYLGLRLNKDFPFERYGKKFPAQFGAYERAYCCEIPPPYFAVAVTYRLLGENSKIIGAMLTEDLSRGNTVQIHAPFNEDYIERIMDERRERFFVDPNDWYGQGFEDLGAKYVEDRARIDVR